MNTATIHLKPECLYERFLFCDARKFPCKCKSCNSTVRQSITYKLLAIDVSASGNIKFILSANGK